MLYLKDVQNVRANSMTHSFPKIIWQTHNYTKDQLPEHLNQIGATWKNLNPGWEYRYIDHKQRDELVRSYPEIYKTYKQQGPTFQSDIWRFLVTYEHGGCYADMDSVCIKPLDYLLQEINPLTQMVTVPVYKGWGNTHNYVTQKHSQPMSRVFNEMIKNPETLIKWQAWEIFIKHVYSDETVSQTFVVQTSENSIADIAANHSKDYKDFFNPYSHQVNNYGKIMKYSDFVQENNLSFGL